jgi:hypothetical protein
MFPQFQVRPHLELSFENILSHINTVYVLKTKPGVMEAEHQDVTQEFSYLRLKVSLTYISLTLGTARLQTRKKQGSSKCLLRVDNQQQLT